MGRSDKDRDLERLMPVGTLAVDVTKINGSKSSDQSPSPSSPSSHHSAKEVFSLYLFIVILFPIAITFYLTWKLINFVDGFFSPIYNHLGIDVFGQYINFLFFDTLLHSNLCHLVLDLVGVSMSSWLGASLLSLGEWIIKKMPLMSYIYTASKQISSAISPDEDSHAFKEVAIIRHPRLGEYACRGTLLCFVPTNHLYLGDVFLINSKDIMRPNLSVREGIEIVISGGMSVPQILTIVDKQSILSPRVGKFAVPKV
ncbi:hypothetical protein H5410_023665 [Solanum commersonii]|uniref:Uncharacterized protein n=1 Tax=Solanum commersonii TaxID=4109 RepID=A0A9J5ZJL6_SOLCO|nr:hypothetical protein H5410_023665 [Solanum commersonii]